MKFEIQKSFERDAKKIHDTAVRNLIGQIIKQVEEVKHLRNVAHCSKLEGYKTAYRIKIGNLRTGLLYEDETVYFIRVLDRKEIYKYFLST